ncbi:MAG: hypothetical protein DBX55_02895 [Verrucomicrobia bacterium]|nr:MAG: hypothetical protein DBX55_02895 [Verrucomicrobiota bacterium]
MDFEFNAVDIFRNVSWEPLLYFFGFLASVFGAGVVGLKIVVLTDDSYADFFRYIENRGDKNDENGFMRYMSARKRAFAFALLAWLIAGAFCYGMLIKTLFWKG